MIVKPLAEGSNIINNPLQIKTIRHDTYHDPESNQEESPINSGDDSPKVSEAQSDRPLTDAEKRAARREEFREAASIREKAIRMQRQAEQRVKETNQLAELLNQAKEDPNVLAKALNMSPEEFQRKIFNKAYSIQEEESQETKEESFEEQTRRRLDEYEQERAQERERQVQQLREAQEANAQRIKHNYIVDKIMPHINESHEFIHQNDKYSCAALAYDLMNQAFQEHAEKGGTEDDFELSPKDVIDQLEEELYQRTEEQLSKARGISKLRKHFSDRLDREEGEFGIARKEFSRPVRRPESRSMTLSHSMGSSAPPSISHSSFSSSSERSSERKIPVSRKQERLARAQRILGQ